MQGDFSRRTFDPSKGYRAVLLQQGRVLLDADVNEQAEITAHHDEVRLLDVVGRTGGPVPPGPTSGDSAASGPFAIVGADEAWATDGTVWEDLRILPGRYYVDGVLAEAEAGVPTGGWPLSDQPHLPALAEPTADTGRGDRYAVWLDVWLRQVTRDEDDTLLEPALGGPDTTTRSRTVWQVRVEQVDATADCETLHTLAAKPRVPRRMTASLQPAAERAKPCEISAVGGYQRLENQLYRVQVHTEPDPEAPAGADADRQAGTFLWSRENGSVVARVLAMDPASEPGTVVLTIDRLGRDDDLGFGEGALVELTGPALELRGEPGFLATIGRPDGVVLPVTWLAEAPASLAALGDRPVLRRWEGRSRLATAPTPLEGGIEVAFPDDVGTVRTGDYWLVPARTVRFAYGLAQLSGTIEWPSREETTHQADGTTVTVQVSLPQPPAGPVLHRAPLALLTRTDGGADAPDVWHPRTDCRDLFAPVTAPVIDLLGGDGQEALPGEFLPVPVRVALRAGAHPVVGAQVRFGTRQAGVLRTSPADELGPDGQPLRRLPTRSIDVTTDTAGVAEIYWRLQPDGPTTQTLSADALDGSGQETGTEVVVSGRLSVAAQVRWTPPDGDQHFPAPTTVQDAVDQLVRHRVLRLLGGDGQSVPADRTVVPQQVRVVVEDGVGPLAGIQVYAKAGDDAAPGLVGLAAEGEPAPASVPGTPGAVVDVTTDENGIARFWWQPTFAGRTSAVLELSLGPADGAPLRVSANLGTGDGAPPPASGLHLTVVRLNGGRPLLDGSVIGLDELQRLELVLDGKVDLGLLERSRAVRVEIDVPWPDSEATPWFTGRTSGTFTVTLDGALKGDGPSIFWAPDQSTAEWLRGQLFKGLERTDRREVTARVVVDGWSVLELSDAEVRRPLNCHADVFVADGRALFQLPTDDATPAGLFVLGFRIQQEAGPWTFTVPDVLGQSSGLAVRRMNNVGFTTMIQFEVVLGAARQGTVLRTDPPPGTQRPEGSQVTLVIATRRLPFPPGPPVPAPPNG